MFNFIDKVAPVLCAGGGIVNTDLHALTSLLNMSFCLEFIATVRTPPPNLLLQNVCIVYVKINFSFN